MKVLIVLDHSAFFPYFETVVTSLCEDRHEVKVITRLGPKGDEEYRQRMHSSIANHRHGSYEFTLRKRADSRRRLIRRLRGAFDYAVYFREQHTSPQLAIRRLDRCPTLARRLVQSRAGRAVISRDGFLNLYRDLQARIPADQQIVAQVAAEAPDVVVSSPFISPMCWALEYVRAARPLGVPTAYAVASWDYLSTKGAFHLMPDYVLVWNERLAEEAEVIHAIPRERTVVTGAAKFDCYFHLRPSLQRARFCRRIGADPARPYLLYLGSSQNIAGDETDFVRDLSRTIASHPATAEAQIVVRPHPLGGAVWENFDEYGVDVFPRIAERPDLEGSRADYVNTLAHAAAAIGVNTSAFLEAAIADLPCLCVLSSRHRRGQAERGHFDHLLRGDFIETVPDLKGAAAALGEIIAGSDPRAEERERFVESFIRPCGIERPAGRSMADAILVAASGCRSHDAVFAGRLQASERAHAQSHSKG